MAGSSGNGVLPPDAGVQRSPRVVSRHLADGGAVILHLDTAAYHGLNPVGTAIWNLLESPSTFDELIDQLMNEFEATPPTFRLEISDFLRDLEQRDLIRLDDGRSQSA